LSFTMIVGLLISTVPVNLHSAGKLAPTKVRSIKPYSITEGQLKLLNEQPNIVFYQELPENLSKEQIGVLVPQQLGGGYFVGTPKEIAEAFNSAGVSVGLTESAVSGYASKMAIGAAPIILGLIISAATGTSKPLTSQMYDRTSANDENKNRAKKKFFEESKGFYPTNVHSTTDHHAAEHHTPDSPSVAKNAPKKKMLEESKNFHPTNVHSTTDHHAAEHHTSGTPTVTATSSTPKKKLFEASKNFHPTQGHSATDHHAADHH